MIYLILAIIGGCLTTMSMVVNASLGKRIGVFQATLVNYIGGVILSIVILLSLRIPLGLNNSGDIPFYAFLGGALGVIGVTSFNYIIPKIPTIYTTLLTFVGQIFAGIIIDYFRFNYLSKGKIIGGILIILGLLYNSNIDRKEEIEEGI